MKINYFLMILFGGVCLIGGFFFWNRSNPKENFKNQPVVFDNPPTTGKGEDVEEKIIKVFKVESESVSTTIEYNQVAKRISGWKNENQEEIVINGAYFLEDFSPAGFLVVDGKTVGQTKFDEDKSGLISIQEGKFTLRDLQKYPLTKNERFDFALQSYPFLIKEGQKAIKEDSGKLARRTAVGIDAENNIYILVVPQREISLYEFMQEIVKLNISFTYVLNLDGGPSTGVSVQWEGEQFLTDSFTPVSSVIRWKRIRLEEILY